MKFRILAHAAACAVLIAACGSAEDDSPGDGADVGEDSTTSRDSGRDITDGGLDVVAEEGCGDGDLDRGERCDDGNLTAGDGCSAECSLEPGYACDSEPSQCGLIDFCDTADCSDLDTECAIGQCDSSAQACVAVPRADDLVCASDDACTMGVCNAGTCDVTEASDCSALTNGCVVGVCEAATGACIRQPIENGASCDTDDLCLSNATCNGGICEGTPTDCSNLNTACAFGTCNSATGACGISAQNDGEVCSDSGDLCNPSTCSLGTCGEPAAVDCSDLDDQCSVGVCDADTGDCSAVALEDDTTCSTGDRCDVNPTCQAGVCTSESIVDCSGLSGACTVGACNPTTGACEPSPANRGEVCGDAMACEDPGVCNNRGQCVGAGPRDCSGLDEACATGVCDVGTDACVAELFTAGDACAGGLCTPGATCDGLGVCSGGSEVDCSGMDTECTVGVCDAMTGACSAVPSNECGACGTGGLCAGGVCTMPVEIDFEGAEGNMLPDGWTSSAIVTSGGADVPGGGFVVTEREVHTGTYAFTSGPIDHGEESILEREVVLDVDSTITFWVFTSSESSDYLEFHIDGTEDEDWSGLTAWTEYSTTLTAGTHTLQWIYDKDGSVHSNADFVAVDDISIDPGCDDGDICTLDLVGPGACFVCPAMEGSSCDDSNACAPAFCTEGECTPEPLDNGVACDSDAVDCVTGTCQSGACDERPIDDCTTCGDDDVNICISGACRFPGSATSVDFETGIPDGWYDTPSEPSWILDSVMPFGDAGTSLRSGDIGNNERSTISTQVNFTAETMVSFQLRTDSEGATSRFDSLEFIVDGELVEAWSGASGEWQYVEFLVGAGNHELSWSFEKDGSSSTGEDAVWIDDVTFGNGDPVCIQPRNTCGVSLLNASGACVICDVPENAPCNGEDGTCDDFGICSAP